MSNHTYAEESWFDPRLEVRRSGIDGKGMFATQPIRAGETVMVWGGIAFTQAEWDSGAVKLDPEAYTCSRIEDDLFIAAPMDAMDHYINHSCDPNLWMHDNITVVARRDIRPGAEVTLDYATIEAHDDVRFAECNCGSGLCRGSVRGDDWQNPELQTRYQGHFQPWIARIMEPAHPTSDGSADPAGATGQASTTATATTIPATPEPVATSAAPAAQPAVRPAVAPESTAQPGETSTALGSTAPQASGS